MLELMCGFILEVEVWFIHVRAHVGILEVEVCFTHVRAHVWAVILEVEVCFTTC